MSRPTTSRPKHELAARPPNEAGASAVLELGGARIEVVGLAPDEVELAITTGGEGRRLRFEAAAVVRWCGEATLLLGASLGVDTHDEVELRTPMLVGVDGDWIALSRRVTDAGSTVALLVAPSVDQLSFAWSSAAADPGAGRALVEALARIARIAR